MPPAALADTVGATVPSGVRTEDVLQALRLRTAILHRALDERVPIAGNAPSLGDYLQHLLALQPWLSAMLAWRARQAVGPDAHAELQPQPQLDWIAEDLRVAGPAACAAAAARVPSAPTAPWPDEAGAAYRWGAAYVLEGSSLGASVLYRRLAGPLAPQPLRFLQASGGMPGPRWARFCQLMRQEVQGPADIAQACAGAADAFGRLLAVYPGPLATAAVLEPAA